MRNFGIAALAAAALAGCASKSSEVTAAYVSPVQFQNYNCQQLSMEAQAVSQRAAVVSGTQDQKRSNDAIATTAAVIVFWPAAFLVGGDGQTAAELSNLKGQMVAIEQASNMKRCGIQFQQPGQAVQASAAGGVQFQCGDGSIVGAPEMCPSPPPVVRAKRAPRPTPRASAPAERPPG